MWRRLLYLPILLLTLGGLSAIATAPLATAAGGNLLQNSSFEEGGTTPSVWTTYAWVEAGDVFTWDASASAGRSSAA